MTTFRCEPAMEIEYLVAFLATTGISGEAGDKLRAQAYSDDLKLFIVENTNKKRALFLAASGHFARMLAVQAGHIHDPKNGRVLVPNDRYFAQSRGFEGAVN